MTTAIVWFYSEAIDLWQNNSILYFCHTIGPILLQSIRSFTRINPPLCDTILPPITMLLYHRINFAAGGNRLFLGLSSHGGLVILGERFGLTLLAVLLPKREIR